MKRKTMKRIIALVLSGAMMMSMAACGETEKKNNQESQTTVKESTVGSENVVESEKPKEPVELSLCLSAAKFGVAKEEGLQMATVAFVEEQTNTILDAIPTEAGQHGTKIDTMIASGDVPDVFEVQSAMSNLPNYVAREKLLALDEYLKDSPLLDAIDDTFLDPLRVNGKTYGIPHELAAVKILLVRKDVMDKYGIEFSSSTPTTEEFVTEMSKLKDSGVIAISAPNWIDNLQFYFNSFGAYAGIYKNEEGKYVDGFQEEAMIDALEYVKALYTEGLLDPEFITNSGAVAREKVYSGNAACILDYPYNYHTFMTTSASLEAPTDYYPIYCLIGPDGEGGSLNEAIQNVLCVSADTENPEAAVELIEALVLDPEVNVAMFYAGVEGKHYTVTDGVAAATEAATNANYAMSYSWVFKNFIEGEEDAVNFKVADDFKANLDTLLEYYDGGIANKGPKYATPTGISATYDEVSASITSEWKSVVSQIILGSVSIEEGMANYKNFWNSIGGTKILEELNANS